MDIFLLLAVLCLSVAGYIFYNIKQNNKNKGTVIDKENQLWEISQLRIMLKLIIFGVSFLAAQINLFLGIIAIIAAWMTYSKYYRDKLELKHFLASVDYEPRAYIKVFIKKESYNTVGIDKKHEVNFMAINDAHQVFFPESSKPNAKYYLSDINFTPKFDTKEGANGEEKRTEKLSEATLTLNPIENPDANMLIRITCITNHYNILEKDFKW